MVDKENRRAILQTLTKRIASLQTAEKEAEVIPQQITATDIKTTSFVDMLKPISGNSQETLDFMISKWAEEEFELQIFSKVHKLPNGKNPYGLNGAIAAMIDFFWQHNYFQKGYYGRSL